MRYFYIICLALSSIFAYKHLSAQEQLKQYAFFVPNNVFLQNTAVNDIEKDVRFSDQKNEEETGKIKPQITLPYVRKKVRPMRPSDFSDQDDVIYERTEKLEPMHTSQQIIDGPEEKAPKIQYSLDDELSEAEKNNNEEKTVVEDFSSLDKYAQLSVEEMLERIPFPDTKKPKYKQLYSAYGMDLRVLQRRGKLPYNREQENTLAKANTIQRFKVE